MIIQSLGLKRSQLLRAIAGCQNCLESAASSECVISCQKMQSFAMDCLHYSVRISLSGGGVQTELGLFSFQNCLKGTNELAANYLASTAT